MAKQNNPQPTQSPPLKPGPKQQPPRPSSPGRGSGQQKGTPRPPKR